MVTDQRKSRPAPAFKQAIRLEALPERPENSTTYMEASV